MKLFARTLLMCAAAPLLSGMPAFAAEQTASISYEDLDTDFVALMPPSPEATMAVLPNAPIQGEEETVAAGIPGTVSVHEGGHGGGGHHGILGALQGPLAVTEDQYEKLYSLRNAYLDTVGPKALQMGQLSRKMKDALVNPNLDAKAVSDLGTKINGLKSEIAAARLDRMIASAQVLTSDQRKALHDKMVRHAVQGMEGMGGGMHGHHHHHH